MWYEKKRKKLCLRIFKRFEYNVKGYWFFEPALKTKCALRPFLQWRIQWIQLFDYSKFIRRKSWRKSSLSQLLTFFPPPIISSNSDILSRKLTKLSPSSSSSDSLYPRNSEVNKRDHTALNLYEKGSEFDHSVMTALHYQRRFW